jgi:dipeptidyl aminopeptidase/acylaminoacyl peptidase
MRGVGAQFPACVVALVTCAAIASPAHATFPGLNGKIVHGGPGGLSTVNPDGTGVWQRGAPGVDYPTWSPDGSRIAYVSRPQPTGDIYLINPDGSGNTLLHAPAGQVEGLTWSPSGDRLAFATGGDIRIVMLDGTLLPDVLSGPAFDRQPNWSPDGAAIVFTSASTSGSDIYTIEPDGDNLQQLTVSPHTDSSPNWSPDGTRITFDRSFTTSSLRDVFTMNADGSDPTRLTFSTGSGFDSSDPAWSPDGQLLVFHGDREGTADGLFIFNPDTHAEQLIVDGHSPDWQAVQPAPAGFYPRPKSAGQVRVGLVPAYAECGPGSADRTHGPPLANPSCSSPDQVSAALTVGTPDANGNPSKAIGYLQTKPRLGDPATTANEADVDTHLLMLDVRNRSDLSDYTGELVAELRVQITDRNNGPGTGAAATGTTTEIPLELAFSCTPTSDATVGSYCELESALNVLIPGAVKEKQRAIWEIGQVRIYDGGADGLADTEPNTLFMTQGLFVP